DGLQPAALGVGQLGVEVGNQGAQVFLLGNGAIGFMGIEIAIGAFAHAPGNMHIECERWQLQHQRLASFSSSWRIARARWLRVFFTSAGSSAAVQFCSRTKNSGS